MGHSDPVTLIEKLTVVAAFLIVMLLVSGCATPGTILVATPPLVTYSKATQSQGSAELREIVPQISDRVPLHL